MHHSLQLFGLVTRSEPGVENSHLVLGRIHKKDPHSDSFVNVDHLAIGYESLFIAGDDDFEWTIKGKGTRGVHVASLAADFGHSPHDARRTPSFEDFRDGKDGIARYCALNAICCIQT